MSKTNNIDYFQNLPQIVRNAIEEDVGPGDITAQLVPEDQHVFASVITREDALVCGRPWFDEVFRQIDNEITIKWLVEEGDEVVPDQTLVEISGNARSILTAERCALNFLQTLMATATTSRMYSNLIGNKSTKILDTRKTIPGLRLAQKYAVFIGGSENHRIGLYDAFLIKENHITSCGSIESAVSKAREISPLALIEVEVENIDELKQGIETGADRIMLDNFSEEQIGQAIHLKKAGITYEISGNITLNEIDKMCLPGIDYISSGALTKHIKAIDLSMRITNYT